MERALLIRNGTVYDGKGAPGVGCDLLVRDGKIEQMAPHGTLAAAMSEAIEIDASSCWVLPGFLDTHTHYDAELALSPGLIESVRHGVTTVVVGSCSVSFVAAAPEDCSDMFTRVEAVPREVVLPLLRDLKRWDTPSGWRRWIDGHPLGPNVGSFLGHSDIRTRAMGLARAVTSDRPTAEEQALMERLLEEALDCGFLGLSCMTNPWDRLDGEREWSRPLPSTFAGRRERGRLLEILRRRGRIHQSAPNLVTRFNVLGMALASAGWLRRPLKTTLITLMDLKADPYVFHLAKALTWITNRVLRGIMRWQSPPVPFDLYYDGWDSVLFEEFPAGQKIRDAAKEKGVRKKLLSDPQFRADFRRDLRRRLAPRVWHRDFSDTLILEAPDSSLVGKSFAQVAALRGADPVDTFLDLLLEYDREIRWHTCLANHRPEVLADIMRYSDTLMSFADSGAHLRNMAFYNFPIRMLKQVLSAQRAGTPIMSIERAVFRLTGELGEWFGLDAGTLEVGARADIVVLDPARLDGRVEKIRMQPWSETHTFPRLVNEGDAARHVFIGGVEVVRDGQPLPPLGKRRTGRFLEARS
jgi:N-acyl-D-aspartate/D-glutamate deacylase